MKFAIIGKNFSRSFHPSLQNLFQTLEEQHIQSIVFEPFFLFMKENLKQTPQITDTFSSPDDLDEKNIDLLLSIGGDGTFLEAISFIRDKNIPIAGINSGRLGFLANISQEEIMMAIHSIIRKDYVIEERTLLEILKPENLFGSFSCGLNDISVQKKDSTMITVHAYLNDQYLNTYWADGLIISTPTGSTAYSLSVGGPIVVPNSHNFILSPIAPHNLTVRPIVIPDDQTIKLKIEARNPEYLVSLDSRSKLFRTTEEIIIKQARFKIRILKLNQHNYYSTLRNKLMWGMDKRN